MTVKDPVTGAIGGPAVDLARELARRRGVEVSLIGVQTPQNVIDAVQNGDADIGFVAYNPEREGPILFSQPFMLVSRHSSFARIRRFSPSRRSTGRIKGLAHDVRTRWPSIWLVR